MSFVRRIERYTFNDLAYDVLKQNNRLMTASEIWEEGKRQGLCQRLNSYGLTPEKTLHVAMYRESLDNPNSRFVQYSKNPSLFGLNSKLVNRLVSSDERRTMKKNEYTEPDLYELLNAYVYHDEGFKCTTKTICTADNEGNWVYPDIVGAHFEFNGFSKEVVEFQARLGYRKHKIYSFVVTKELNLRNLRECYFRTVSNSSWANEGYLVTCQLSEDEQLRTELRQLNSAFGIGVIKLNAENASKSEVICPSKVSENLDWSFIERLKENSNFVEFIRGITNN